jgi:hypothetical protein
MKTCIKCNQPKPKEEFTRKKKNCDERRNVCTVCCRKYQHEHYTQNKEQYVRRAIGFNGKQATQNKLNLVELLEKNRCADCGNTDIRVLEFDHKLPDAKVENISTMIYRYKWDVILEEISKCDIRCANCHRIKTAMQLNWFKGKNFS